MKDNKILRYIFNIACIELGIVCSVMPCSLLYLLYIEFRYYIEYYTWILNGGIISCSIAFFCAHGLIWLFSLVIPKIAWKFNELRPLSCFLYSLFFTVIFFCATYLMELRYIMIKINSQQRDIENTAGDWTAAMLPFVIYFTTKFILVPALTRQRIKNNTAEILN